ncbi:hypothetical protein ACO1O0_003694 [Amphichorda felina]
MAETIPLQNSDATAGEHVQSTDTTMGTVTETPTRANTAVAATTVTPRPATHREVMVVVTTATPLAGDGPPDEKLNNAAKAAINAAAVEAIRVRGQPGEWAGPKGVRVATAALGAAATDAAADKFHEGDGDEKKGKRDHIKSAIGGLLANRVLNGPRDELRRHQ